ncbi:universal stress protein [Streptomyces fradiae]|uniref:universal stress protein n=1 Tax=Streptomyces fradiae TaxID=1906 RepID=UPI0036F926A5
MTGPAAHGDGPAEAAGGTQDAGVPEAPGDVLVGVDPQDFPVPALAWAADEAARRRARLRLVLALPPHDSRYADSDHRRSTARWAGETALVAAAETVRSLRPRLPVVTALLDGRPAEVLCRLSEGAGLVVVGSRRLSRAEEFLSAGSVVVPVSARADCPVAVVGRPGHAAGGPRPLVVGIDGSTHSVAAAAFAFREAALRGTSVRALWIWRWPAVPPAEEGDAVRERRRLLAGALAPLRSAHPDIGVAQEVLRGHPVEELARASADAAAVVVGRRGRGGYTGMRLGSVVHGLLHRAECPVITVPSKQRE